MCTRDSSHSPESDSCNDIIYSAHFFWYIWEKNICLDLTLRFYMLARHTKNHVWYINHGNYISSFLPLSNFPPLALSRAAQSFMSLILLFHCLTTTDDFCKKKVFWLSMFHVIAIKMPRQVISEKNYLSTLVVGTLLLKMMSKQLLRWKI